MPIPRVNLLKSIPRKSLLLVVVVLALLALTLVDWDELRTDRREETTVALSETPAPVRTTIEQETKGGTLKEIEKSSVDGKTIYAATIVVNGKQQETRIGEDGKVVGRGAAERDHDD